MKKLLPKIKKSIKGYALNEDGKISKQSLITMGALIGSGALTGVLKANDAVAHGNSHANQISLQVVNLKAIGRHVHHASY